MRILKAFGERCLMRLFAYYFRQLGRALVYYGNKNLEEQQKVRQQEEESGDVIPIHHL